MSNRLYPTWEQLEASTNPLTLGEKALIRYLDEQLPRDDEWTVAQPIRAYRGWLIFAQPFLNGTRPDVIIFNPSVGIVIYEVKDWNLSLYSWQNKRLHVTAGSGRQQPVNSPIQQVHYYREKLIGQLVPIIGEAFDKHKNSFALVKTAVYFHCATTASARKLFQAQVSDFKYEPVFGHDELQPQSLAAICPDVERTSSYYWQARWNDEVLFWLSPPFHTIEQGIPLRLHRTQLKLAEPSPGHHRARGVAGGGKTQALAYRAAKLASQGQHVLIISFNITLWHYIRDMIARAPFNFPWSNITFNHFHGFCRDRLHEFDQNWPHGPSQTEFDSHEEYAAAREEFFRATVPEAVVKALTAKQHRYQRYDAILIDEGQDYYVEWYELLDQHFLTARDELLVLCDKKQNIYERELDWLDKRVTRKGLDKFKDPYIDLTVTFRLPRKVAVMTNDFSVRFNLNQELKVGKFEEQPILVHSQHIVWRNINEEDWLENCHFAFLRLRKSGYSASDMVILLPNHQKGFEAVRFFEKQSLAVNHVFEDGTDKKHHHKKSFWMGDSRLKLSTIHSFKGWELINIVLFIPATSSESLVQLDAMVYTALTRTRENLIVLNANSRYSEFGEQFPKVWDDQNAYVG